MQQNTDKLQSWPLWPLYPNVPWASNVKGWKKTLFPIRRPTWPFVSFQWLAMHATGNRSCTTSSSMMVASANDVYSATGAAYPNCKVLERCKEKETFGSSDGKRSPSPVNSNDWMRVTSVLVLQVFRERPFTWGKRRSQTSVILWLVSKNNWRIPNPWAEMLSALDWFFSFLLRTCIIIKQNKTDRSASGIITVSVFCINSLKHNHNQQKHVSRSG